MKRVRYLDNTYWVFLFLMFVGLGFLGSVYAALHQSQAAKHAYSTVEIRRTHALDYRLHQLEYQNAHLTSQMTELTLRAGHQLEDGRVSRVNALEQMMGLVEQSGPGLVVVLKDSTKPTLLGDNPNTGIIHNTDLAQVVNELRAAGAKAIAINGQPVTGMTGINCSGPIITINGVRMASPFEVQALGDSQSMQQYLQRQTSFLRELKKYDIQVDVASKNVMIPAASAG